MKLNKILFSLMAAFSLLAVSCQEELAYTPGEPDLEGCYGVYFPTQDAAGDHTMDPSETPEVEIVVKRLVDEGDITVPVNVIVSEEGIFNVPELTFVDGQSEQTLKVTFPNAKSGVTYTLALEITDPEYASTYGANNTFFTYSVVIEKYEYLGKALYREDILTALFGVTNEEWEVDVYTKDTQPGVYYLAGVYDPANCPLLSSNSSVYKDSYMVIDASNPQKVYMPFQYMGLVVNSQYGECATGSYAPEAGFNVAEGVYGTMINKVITFPAQGLLFGMELYNNFGFYYANPDGMFRVVLPGAVLTDYTFDMVAGFSSNGVQPVQFTFGADVASIKYAAYAGPLAKADLEEKVAELAASTTAKSVARPTEGDAAVVGFSFDATGKYTVVAVSCDETGAPQDASSLVLSYVAAGDEVAVVVNAGLGSADKYVPLGVSPETAAEFYVYGQDLVDLKLGLFSYADLVADQNACVSAVLASASAPAEILDQVNNGVYVDVMEGLMPGTEYYMIVYASNGYEQTAILTDPFTTAGEPSPIYQSFTAADIDGSILPETSEGYFGTYNYYAKYDGPVRGLMGQVTISDSEIPDSDPDNYGLVDEYVEVKGLFAGIQEYFGIEDDTVIFDYYGGVIYVLENSIGKGYHSQVGEIYVGLCQGKPDGGGVFVGYNGLMIGGYVDEGYLAFVTEPNYEAAGYNINTFYMYAYGDEECTKKLGYLDYFMEPLLVDAAVDPNAAAAKPAASRSTLSRSDLGNIQYNYSSDFNCVETERGRVRSAIDKMNATKKAPKAVGTPAGIKGEWSAPSVEFTAVETSADFQTVTTDFSKVNDAKPVLCR